MVILDNHSSDAMWCCKITDGNGLWYTERCGMQLGGACTHVTHAHEGAVAHTSGVTANPLEHQQLDV
jgi:hypothetical protein